MLFHFFYLEHLCNINSLLFYVNTYPSICSDILVFHYSLFQTLYKTHYIIFKLYYKNQTSILKFNPFTIFTLIRCYDAFHRRR